jgi:hypothetical protein
VKKISRIAIVMLIAGISACFAQAGATSYGTSTAATTSYGSSDAATSVNAGAKAVLFDFSGLSFLGANSFNGGIGAKYFITAPLALRAGLQFGHGSKDTPANPGVGQAGADGSATATTFGINAAAEYHLLPTRVSPYFGGGILFSTTTTESKNPVTYVPPAANPQVTTKDNQNGENIDGVAYLAGMKFMIGALAGVEFFLAKEISLAAEYRLGYALTSRSDQQVINANVTTTTKVGSSSTFAIDNTGALTLAVYF